VAVRTRLRQLTPADEKVLALVGAHLGALASRDLKVRCGQGLEHSADTWAARKRALTAVSSSRWAGSLTKATHDQWALARRCQLAHIQSLEAGIRTIAHRLSLPVGAKGSKNTPGGYRSRREWHAKSRRLRVLEDRLERARAGWEAGVVHVVRGGKRLARTRHQLSAAQLTEDQWRRLWEAERWFVQADGESGKRYGNETIRIHPGGEVSIKLPAPLAGLANAPHGRYILTANVRFPHRGQEWADRVAANRAVAYRIHYDTGRGRWYVTASWQIPVSHTVPPAAALADGVIGVDLNADHLAARGLSFGPSGVRRFSRSGRSAEHESWQQESLPLSLQERFQVGFRACQGGWFSSERNTTTNPGGIPHEAQHRHRHRHDRGPGRRRCGNGPGGLRRRWSGGPAGGRAGGRRHPGGVRRGDGRRRRLRRAAAHAGHRGLRRPRRR
jgi:hypothetical protein